MFVEVSNPYSTKQLSMATGVPESRIRSWEKKGLLKPADIWYTNVGAHPVYIKRDIDLVNVIVEMRKQKIGLNEIKRILDL